MSRRRKVDPMEPSRRDFLWKGACAALTATGIATTIRDLRLINAATCAASLPTDYKALVCIFLFGGNDGNNLLIPTDSRYNSQYNTANNARGSLALPLMPTASQPNAIIPLHATNVGSATLTEFTRIVQSLQRSSTVAKSMLATSVRFWRPSPRPSTTAAPARPSRHSFSATPTSNWSGRLPGGSTAENRLGRAIRRPSLHAEWQQCRFHEHLLAGANTLQVGMSSMNTTYRRAARFR